jgi:transcriptional regulator with XRE-family HTH domain
VINRHELKALRTEAGLTQAGLARKAGLSKQIICDLERGRRLGQNEPTLAALADALGVTVWDLTTKPRPAAQGSTT